jgi:hypothetical protein
MITIDARGAGEGKTTTGIYPRIDLLRSLGENILLVVPSQALQDQYERHFNISDFVKINSQLDEIVCESIIRNISTRDNIIMCITHEAWVRLSVPLHIKQRWNLIIDEAIMPFRTVTWESRRNFIDWSQMIQLPEDTILADDAVFVRVSVNQDQNDSWTQQISEIKRLQNTGWETYTRTTSYQKLQANSAGRAEFVQSLDISHIQHWKSASIAAAAFDRTFMAHWLKFNKVPYLITQPFVARALPIHLHCPEELNWSRYKQRNQTDIIVKYSEYVNQICLEQQMEPLVVRNNSSKNQLANEVKLNHNPHGLNQYTDYRAISLETALNPSQEFGDWLKQDVNMTPEAITSAFSGYIFYQIIMRSCLRTPENKSTAHLFLLDYRTAVSLGDYLMIDTRQISFIDVGFTEKPRGRRRSRTPAMTSAERVKFHREKKRQMK